MTKRKPKDEWKVNVRPKPKLVGGDTKVCLGCGATIKRNGAGNFEWIRRTFCSKECRYIAINQAAWKRRRVVDG